MIHDLLKAAVVVGVLVVTSRPAEGTSCAGSVSIASAYRNATVVVVATVDKVLRPKATFTVLPDSSTMGEFKSGPDRVEVSLKTIFKGTRENRADLVSDFKFVENGTYLIYGSFKERAVEVSLCSRTRAIEDATEDLKYLNGLITGVAQSILFGDVFRRAVDNAGQPGLYSPTEIYDIVAIRNGVRHHTTTSKQGQFQLVLPPGSYQMWLEHSGRALTNPEIVDLRENDERQRVLVVETKH